MKKILILLLPVIFCCSVLEAAPRQLYSVSWEMGQPLGKYTSFVSNFSTRGIGFNAQIFVHKNIAVGLQLAWHSYYGNKGKQTMQLGEKSAITAYSYNHLEDIPILAHVYYHIIPQNKYIQPYIGLAIGTTHTIEDILIQDMAFSDKTWGFNITPEVGVLVPFGDAPVGLNVYAKYAVAFNKYSYMGEQLNPYQCLNIGVGITFILDKK